MFDTMISGEGRQMSGGGALAVHSSRRRDGCDAHDRASVQQLDTGSTVVLRRHLSRSSGVTVCNINHAINRLSVDLAPAR